MKRSITPIPDVVSFEALRDEYLFCRTVGHAWEPVTTSDLPEPDFGFRMSMQCVRCNTHRHQIIDPRLGDSISRRYDYPDGYKLDHKVTRSEMRLEWVERRNYDFVQENRKKRKKR